MALRCRKLVKNSVSRNHYFQHAAFNKVLRFCLPAVAISYVLFDTWDKYNKTLADAQQKLTARQDVPASVDRAK